jgi:arsenate reductase
MATLKVYTLSNCDTCRRAVKWLKARDIAFEERAIRETPPSPSELRAMLAAHGGKFRPLFNTAGREYRALKLSEKMPTMTPSAALLLLAENGSLVKRPFVVGDGVALVGFDEEAWSAAFR